ncbi:hypothetical protein [Sphingomonas aracearum]|uniref:Uncharacterized protein n=1 Tax=Sphingomonas aracearum TaxID=2283317 RepID=A0A369VZM2_9SPHN|nr:hypothetical protein [Sphingomonas aracearum]RDE07075.1 hypothetical protein DVW87_05305 [Sphingomonas aracearum]
MTVSKLAATALLSAGLALSAPAFAKTRVITLPSTTFKTPETKLCMLAESAGIKVEKGAPKTMCLTRADWEAQGVTFKLK